jgi:hypothetical protein
MLLTDGELDVRCLADLAPEHNQQHGQGKDEKGGQKGEVRNIMRILRIIVVDPCPGPDVAGAMDPLPAAA